MKNENNERTSQEVDLLKKIFGADYFDKVEIPIPTELLTFENEFQKIYDVECSDFAKMFYLKLRLEVLKSTVELSDFVPCGDDGLPLEEIKDLPKNIQIENLEQVEKYHKFHIYQKAKQAVIFEGWEVESHDKHDGWMTLKNGLHTLVFDLMPCNDVWICDLEVNTYSDLAKATINNPLKFRK